MTAAVPGSEVRTAFRWLLLFGCAVAFVVSAGWRVAAAPANPPFDYFENSWSVIGLKDYNDATRLTPDNELLLAAPNRLQISYGPESTPLSRKQTKTLLDGWLPIVQLNAEAGGVRYDFTLWATPLPDVTDWKAAFDWPVEGENFLNWVQVRAVNTGAEPAEARVQIVHGTTNQSTSVVWLKELPARKSAETVFRIPFAATRDHTAFDTASPKLWLDRTVKYWRGVMAEAARIEVPCEKANQALLASHVCQLIANDRGVIHAGEGFYDEFLHSTATHAFPEGIYFQPRTAWNDTIPHATGASNFAFLLRHGLVHEFGNELHLLAGIPDWWLENGREIRVENAPTHFGPLSLQVRGTTKGVKVRLTAPARSSPERIILHLPKSRPVERPVPLVEVDYCDDQTKRWDFPSVVQLYRSQNSNGGKP